MKAFVDGLVDNDEKVASSSLSIRSINKALHDALNIDLNKGTKYKAGLTQGID